MSSVHYRHTLLVLEFLPLYILKKIRIENPKEIEWKVENK